MTAIRFSTMTIAKRKCKCGRLITFERLFPVTCFDCGRLVYPTKKMEVIAKIKELKLKKENEKR